MNNSTLVTVHQAYGVESNFAQGRFVTPAVLNEGDSRYDLALLSISMRTFAHRVEQFLKQGDPLAARTLALEGCNFAISFDGVASEAFAEILLSLAKAHTELGEPRAAWAVCSDSIKISQSFRKNSKVTARANDLLQLLRQRLGCAAESMRFAVNPHFRLEMHTL